MLCDNMKPDMMAQTFIDHLAVNSFGSAAQAGFVFLLLPVLCYLRGIDLMQLPQYLREGISTALHLNWSLGETLFKGWNLVNQPHLSSR